MVRADREDVLDRIHDEMNVEMRFVVDAGRNVPVRIPVEQRPFERQVRRPARFARHRKDSLVPAGTLAHEVERSVVVQVEAVMPVRHRRGKVIERIAREQDAHGLHRAGRVDVGIARDSPTA